MKYIISDLMQQSDVKFGTSGIRGLVSQMTPPICYAYAKGFLQTLDLNKGSMILIGHDLRPSSPTIAKVVIQAIKHMGFKTIYAGTVPTPTLALYSQEKSLPAIMITGSHIPFDRNGIKFYNEMGEISKADEDNILNQKVVIEESLQLEPLPLIEHDVSNLYISRYVDFFGSEIFKDLTIGFYEHSSVGRDILKKILISLGAQVISLGRTNEFIPVDTEAVNPQDELKALKWSNEYKLDAIFSTDGDADRPLMADENGVFLRGDVLGVLCARFLGLTAIATPISCNTMIEKSGFFKKITRTNIGSPYVIKGMKDLSQENFKVGGFEANGGFLLGSDIKINGRSIKALPTRDAALPIISTLAIANKRKISLLLKNLPQRFTFSSRLQNISNEKSKTILSQIKNDKDKIKNIMNPIGGFITDINEQDGFRVTFENGDIVHLRPSGNAPELRCYSESQNYELAKQLVLNCLNNIKNSLEMMVY